MLPRGEYTVVVYDDEDAEVENPAYNATITISSSPKKLSGIFLYTCTNQSMFYDLHKIGCESKISEREHGLSKGAMENIITK